MVFFFHHNVLPLHISGCPENPISTMYSKRLLYHLLHLLIIILFSPLPVHLIWGSSQIFHLFWMFCYLFPVLCLSKSEPRDLKLEKYRYQRCFKKGNLGQYHVIVTLIWSYVQYLLLVLSKISSRDDTSFRFI